MAIQASVFEGTWDELAAHASELRLYPRLMLIVPSLPEDLSNSRYRSDLTPAERVAILDGIASRNRDIPALPPEAFERESLYAD